MAKIVNSRVIVFDAEGQGEGFAANFDTKISIWEPQDETPAMGTETVVFDVPLYVREFKVVTGSGGDVQLYSRKVAGDADPTEEYRPDERKRYEVLFLDATPADDTIWVPYGDYVDGLYVEDLPANGKIYAYLGEG